MSALESDSVRVGISINALSNSILGRWARWDRYIQKLDMISVPKDVLSALVSGADEKYMRALVDTTFPFFRESVILMKGKYDLKRSIEALEDYTHTANIVSDHTVDGPIHFFTIRHGMGDMWSIFTKVFLERLFSEFVPHDDVEYVVEENIVVAKISLGSKWDEHDY